MASEKRFDAYYVWLGIPPEDQPAHFYRLLDVAKFEANLEAIDIGYQRRILFLRSIRSDDRSALVERLKNELTEAHRCLLNPTKKAAYDAELRQVIARRSAPAVPAVSSVAPPYPTPPNSPAAYWEAIPLEPIPVADDEPPISGLSVGTNFVRRLLPIGIVLACVSLVGAIGYAITSRTATLVVKMSEPDATATLIASSGAIELEQPMIVGPNTISLAAGRHRLLVAKSGFRVFRANIEIASGDVATVTVPLKAERISAANLSAMVETSPQPIATSAMLLASVGPSRTVQMKDPTNSSVSGRSTTSSTGIGLSGIAPTSPDTMTPQSVAPRPSDAERAALVGAPAAEIVGARWLKGGPTSLAERRGKPVLLCFWAVWCPSCIRAFPYINSLEKRYAPQGFTTIAITPPHSFRWDSARAQVVPSGEGDAAADAAAMIAFAEHYELQSPIAVVAGQDFIRKYASTAIPTLALVDDVGHIRSITVGTGTASYNAIETELRRVLKLAPIPSSEMAAAMVIAPTQDTLGPSLPVAQAQQAFIVSHIRLAEESRPTGRQFVGSPLKFGYSFTNNGPTDYPRTTTGTIPARALTLGYLERLGEDSTISVLPRRLVREGNKYALGGPLNSMPSGMRQGSKMMISRMLDTSGFPPGLYRFELRHCNASDNTVLQATNCEFELVAAPDSEGDAAGRGDGSGMAGIGPVPRLEFKQETPTPPASRQSSRIALIVVNRSEYSDSAFASFDSGNGMTTLGKSRTSLLVYDADTDRVLHGSYYMKSAAELDDIAFDVSNRSRRPNGVYIVLHDLQTNQRLRSNDIALPPPSQGFSPATAGRDE